ncbi:hypothetical protein EYF80_013942 [Liparis tanakae]|uniref:Uncharacterized protein n=1 Tax=Liparis tanakae TaxID=230148 RepID=A0A4Z2IE38_9TELE|nr:hypothetical protein EYF80_013942 [Liparis tanakae]
MPQSVQEEQEEAHLNSSRTISAKALRKEISESGRPHQPPSWLDARFGTGLKSHCIDSEKPSHIPTLF